MKYFIKTFGCQMNLADSERIVRILGDSGLEKVSRPGDADIIIFNTCSVRKKGEDRVFSFMKDYKKANPKVLAGLTGCMVRETGTRDESFKSKDPLFRRSRFIDFIFRIEDMRHLPKILSFLSGENLGIDFSDNLESLKEDTLNYMKIRPVLTNKFQAFVPIQTGCDKFCSYCIVPYARKRERSRPMNLIIKEVEDLVSEGCKEITLLGQSVNSYNPDKLSRVKYNELVETPFVTLLKQLNKVEGLSRIRYTSPHPADMKDCLIEAHASLDKLCEYIHFPLQSGSNKVLKSMNRSYTREEYLEIVKKFKEKVPGIAMSTDIIVGFCGETKENFEDTYDLFKEIGFDFSYTARYSPRKGTLADKRMEDDVPIQEKARRWHRLNDLLKEISEKKYADMVGKSFEILVEKARESFIEGKTRGFKTVQVDKKALGKDVQVGDLVNVEIIGSDVWVAKGKIKRQDLGRSFC